MPKKNVTLTRSEARLLVRRLENADEPLTSTEADLVDRLKGSVTADADTLRALDAAAREVEVALDDLELPQDVKARLRASVSNILSLGLNAHADLLGACS